MHRYRPGWRRNVFHPLWAGRRGSITRETLLRPRPGSSYEIRVSYRDDLYDVAIRDSGGREVELVGLGACRP